MTPEPRPRRERIIDVRRRLTDDVDLWVATASADGLPHLVPLSFLWTDDRILLSTTVAAPTARNLLRSCAAQLALGHTRDVVWIDAELDLFCEASAIDVGPATRSRAGRASTRGRCAAMRSSGCDRCASAPGARRTSSPIAT